MGSEIPVVTVFIGLAVAFFLAIYAVARRYKKIGPNMVMIISGRKYRIKNPTEASTRSGFASVAAAARSSCRWSRKSTCSASRS